MRWKNSVEFKVTGRYALFSDPITKLGGEKFSYQVPTYQAIKGILESVYWKPTFIWVIDEIRIMNPIRTQSQGIRPINYTGGNTLAIYTYLTNVEYQVKAHFEWNEYRQDLEKDRNEDKHYQIAKRMIEKGGRRDIFLGTRECQGYVESCIFGEGKGFYDDYGEISFGMMFHGFDYPDEYINNQGIESRLVTRLWEAKMKDGIIKFIKPNECTIKREISQMKPKEFNESNFSGLEEFRKEDGAIELDE